MERKTARGIAWAAGILSVSAIAGGLYYKFQKEAYLLSQYCYKITGFRLVTLNKDGFVGAFKVKILNRSSIAATITGYSFDIYLNGKRVGKVYSNKEQPIPANDSTEFEMIADISYVDKFSVFEIINLGVLVASKNNWSKVKIKFDGKISVKAAGIKVSNIPVNTEMTLAEMTTSDPNAMECPKNF